MTTLAARWRVGRLELKEPFTIATGTVTDSPHVIVEIERDGVIGQGEAAPIWFYGESAETVLAVLPTLTSLIDDPWDWDRVDRRVQQAFGGAHPSACCAVTTAVLDLCAKEVGLPAHQLMGLGTSCACTSYTIGISSPADTDRKVRAALDAGFQIIKIKLGGSDDRATMSALRRAAPDAVVRVDANTGWDRATALAMLPVLVDHGVELLEQPLAAADVEGHRTIRDRSPIPVIADESMGPFSRLRDVASAFDGINLKLAKNGGPFRVIKLAHAARELGLSILFGCMLESSLAIAAAAHLAALVDWVDLDSPLEITNDPFVGLSYVDGRPTVGGPGLGVTARPAAG